VDKPQRDISVVVIARNEEDCIQKCLRSLQAQDYPKEHYEVVLVDNGSTDRTQEIARAVSDQFPNLRIVENPIPGIAVTRNVGIQAARHEVVAFIDADCEASESWLTWLEKAFTEETAKDARVVAIGGPNTMPGETTFFRRAVAVATTNYWGNHGSVQAKILDQRLEVDHLPTLNVLYDRQKVVDIGMFDEYQGNISEDVDLSHRLRQKGFKLLFEPRAGITHKWREDIWSWMKNMEVYGKGRTWLMRKDPSHIKPQFAAPILLLTACAMALISPFLPSPINFLFAAPLSTYVVLTLIVSLYACFTHGKPHYVPMVFVIYAVTHLSYGVGQIHGAIARRGSDTRRGSETKGAT
jgi:glycosyltransferase involved in cell wall biosynthesis